MSIYSPLRAIVSGVSRLLLEWSDKRSQAHANYLQADPMLYDASDLALSISSLIKSDFNNLQCPPEAEPKYSDTVLILSFQASLQVIFDVQATLLSDMNKDEERVHFDHLYALLDLAVLLFKGFAFNKRIFYESLSQILKFLIPISATAVEQFWRYMEARQDIIREHIFDVNSVADRISLLDLHNSITNDLCFHNNNSPLRNATWADNLKARVRFLLANILQFEDTTGLNKYFKSAEREPPKARVDSSFLEDIVLLHKIFNNPCRILASTSDMKETVLVVKGVSAYLLREEEAHARPKSRGTTAGADSKIDNIFSNGIFKNDGWFYFSDSYWLYEFDTNKLLTLDSNFMKSQFAKRNVRTQYLFMLCILANLYIELTTLAHKEFMSALGLGPNTKHVADGTLTETHNDFFVTIKKSILDTFKKSDPEFADLLEQSCISEKIWWSWLICGKDLVSGKPLVLNATILAETLHGIANAKEVLPYKTKRYFNTYITPQLGRRMKVETGLGKLEKQQQQCISDAELERKIAELTEKIESPDPTRSSELQDLADQRTNIYWRLLRQQRNTRWCSFNKIFNSELIGGVKKTNENVKDAPTQEVEDEEAKGIANDATVVPAKRLAEDTTVQVKRAKPVASVSV